jgi:hypothetical protein
MFLTTLLTAVTISVAAPAQDAPKPTPRRKAANPPKVCSIPLINVTPPARPFIPRVKPSNRIDSRIIVPPPAPPCDDKRTGTPKTQARP